eukprot:1142527-Pelagomonas_calceolata.AAC.1
MEPEIRFYLEGGKKKQACQAVQADSHALRGYLPDLIETESKEKKCNVGRGKLSCALFNMVCFTVVTMGGDLQPGRLADRLLWCSRS